MGTGQWPRPVLHRPAPARHQALLPHYPARHWGPWGEGLGNGPQAPGSACPTSHACALSLQPAAQTRPSLSPAPICRIRAPFSAQPWNWGLQVLMQWG